MTTLYRRLLMVVILFLGGCSSMKSVDVAPEALHQMILTGNVLQPGQTARVTTDDGKARKFRVVEVDTTTRTIRGEDVVIDVDDVAAVETREFSLGKTVGLVGGILLLLNNIADAAPTPGL